MRKLLLLTVICLVVLFSINVMAAEEVTEVPEKTGMAFKTTDAITLDGYSDEWEKVMKWKADPMYTGDQFDVLPKSMAWMKWDENNLYIFVRVMDSAVSVPKPKQFWAVDTVEFFLDGDNDKTTGYDVNDAQFWVCPGGAGEDGNGIYIGQWKREGDGIEETLYGNVSGVEGQYYLDDKGYTLEVKIPAANLNLDGFSDGQKIGFNYTVFDIEFGGTFWATSKAVATHEHPELWGTVELVE